ncbi:MAG: hypothetical protein H7Y42_08620 [Chitinophagaceae bacterium]|nr:hypothetical protein [Chitinophagaceae bacterium]
MEKNKIPLLVSILSFSLCLDCRSQVADTSGQRNSIVPTQSSGKPEIFTNGFIDILNNGQMSASARLIRVYIGEPGRFAVPLSFYSGVTANNFQQQVSIGGVRSNDHLFHAFINPLSGLINISSEGKFYFSNALSVSRLGFLYQVGEKILTGYKVGPAMNPSTGRPINFLNSFFSAGLYFQTGAWEKTNHEEMGIFWLLCRLHICYSSPFILKDFLPGILTNGVYSGYSAGFGVEINNLVNIKLIFYEYIKPLELDYSQPVYQFSFNYSIR